MLSLNNDKILTTVADVKKYKSEILALLEVENMTVNPNCGNVYYAIQSSETFYSQFYEDNYVEYADGTFSIYNTIQGAFNACMANRGDTVFIIGGWTITDTLTLDRIYGLKVIGGNPFNVYTGGSCEITYNGMGTCFAISNPKLLLSDITFYIGGATHNSSTICLDLSGRVFSHGVIKNINIRKLDGTDAQGHAIKTGSPSSSWFENIHINSPAGNGKRWQTGILQTGDDLCNYKNLVIGGTEGFAIYNPGSTRSNFDGLKIMPSCDDGIVITGVTSAITDSRIMSAAPGTATAAISACYTTGTTAFTGT
jgi:hypothetical protein